jgi:hypothetical protein
MLVQASFDDIKGSRDLFESTKAVLFLGTPHAGSPFAGMGDTLRGIVKAVGFSTANQNLRDLNPDSAMLEQCRVNFQTLHRRGGFEVYTFQEELGMTGIGIAKADNKGCSHTLHDVDNHDDADRNSGCSGHFIRVSRLGWQIHDQCQSHDDVQVLEQRGYRL